MGPLKSLELPVSGRPGWVRHRDDVGELREDFVVDVWLPVEFVHVGNARRMSGSRLPEGDGGRMLGEPL